MIDWNVFAKTDRFFIKKYQAETNLDCYLLVDCSASMDKVNPATGRLQIWATPLFVVLVMVNVADVIFAVDSVPAIFAITTDTFIVYTSNIFAILGLRALYFALAAMIERFVYLKYALALVLIFIGGKIFIADMLGLAKIPPSISLGVTFAILGAGIAVSLWKTRSGAAKS